jgi:basic membrane protein A
MKRMDATVYQVIEMTMAGEFEGGVIVGTLENGGVDLAPFHDLADEVPDDLEAELADVRAGIIDGSIAVGGE